MNRRMIGLLLLSVFWVSASITQAADAPATQPTLSAEGVKALILQLDDAAWTTREAAQARLTEVAEPHRAILEEALKNASPEAADRLRQLLAAPRSTETAVHVVGVYEGRHAPDKPRPKGRQPGRVPVTVEPGKRKVVLVLCAYEPVEWEVKIMPGATVERVVLGGYHAQTVVGLPETLKADVHTHEGGSDQWFFAYQDNVQAEDPEDALAYDRMLTRLRALVAAPVTTFQGYYTVAEDELSLRVRPDELVTAARAEKIAEQP